MYNCEEKNSGKNIPIDRIAILIPCYNESKTIEKVVLDWKNALPEAICCVRKDERKNGRGRWKTDNPFRYESVIRIDNRPSLVEGLRDMCPYPVGDLRDSPEYRLN